RSTRLSSRGTSTASMSPPTAACKVARLACLSGPSVASGGGVEAPGAAVPLARMMSGAGGSQGQSGHRGQSDVFHACIVGQTCETVKPLMLLAVKCVPPLSLCGTQMVRQGTARRCLSFCLMLEQSKTLQCEERRRVGFSTWDVLRPSVSIY